MKRITFKFLITVCLSIMTIANSCTGDFPTPEPVPPTTVGAYILNGGNFKSNDACLSFYDPSTKSVSSGIFLSKNGKKLGDTAQDMVIYGSKMYIAVYNSKIIFVTDKEGKIIKEITLPSDDGANMSPRYFEASGGKLYTTFHEGWLAEIDTTSLSVARKVKVGNNPEQVRYSNGKLYVANSGGLNYPNYDKTVSVVDAGTMTLLRTLDVVLNPNYLQTDSQGDLYLISIGNYADVPNTLQRIDTKADRVTVIPNVSATFMSMGKDDRLYFVGSTYDADWNAVYTFSVFDALTDTITGDFITDGTVINGACSITADHLSGNVYIGTSDYVSTGDMYLLSSEGKLIDKFDTQGLNPMGVFFLTE